jgi:hypothetical protein
MSSKIFPPRLAPSADDPLREDREAEVDASSVVCLVFVASRSIIISWLILFFFFQKVPRHEKGGALLCGALARFAFSQNAAAHIIIKSNHSHNERKKKRLNLKSREKQKKHVFFFRTRARESTPKAHSHARTRVIVKG